MATKDLPPIRRGDNIKFDVTITLDGAALDLTTYSIWCTGKRDLIDPDVSAVFQGTKAGGQITVIGGGNNIARVNIPGSQTASLTDDVTVFYDVQIKSTGGDIDTVADGRLPIVLDVTQAT